MQLLQQVPFSIKYYLLVVGIILMRRRSFKIFSGWPPQQPMAITYYKYVL